MAETKIAYSGDIALAVTEWDATLAAGDWATSAIFDNTSTLYVDVTAGGVLELDATTPVVGDTMDIYISAQFDKDVVTGMTGGIDALFDAATEETEDVAFVKANLILFKSVSVEATTPANAKGYVWGPVGVAQFFGGIMPQRWFLILHNNTAGTMAAGPVVNTVGITYTTV